MNPNNRPRMGERFAPDSQVTSSVIVDVVKADIYAQIEKRGQEVERSLDTAVVFNEQVERAAILIAETAQHAINHSVHKAAVLTNATTRSQDTDQYQARQSQLARVLTLNYVNLYLKPCMKITMGSDAVSPLQNMFIGIATEIFKRNTQNVTLDGNIQKIDFESFSIENLTQVQATVDRIQGYPANLPGLYDLFDQATKVPGQSSETGRAFSFSAMIALAAQNYAQNQAQRANVSLLHGKFDHRRSGKWDNVKEAEMMLALGSMSQEKRKEFYDYTLSQDNDGHNQSIYYIAVMFGDYNPASFRAYLINSRPSGMQPRSRDQLVNFINNNGGTTYSFFLNQERQIQEGDETHDSRVADGNVDKVLLGAYFGVNSLVTFFTSVATIINGVKPSEDNSPLTDEQKRTIKERIQAFVDKFRGPDKIKRMLSSNTVNFIMGLIDSAYGAAVHAGWAGVSFGLSRLSYRMIQNPNRRMADNLALAKQDFDEFMDRFRSDPDEMKIELVREQYPEVIRTVSFMRHEAFSVLTKPSVVEAFKKLGQEFREAQKTQAGSRNLAATFSVARVLNNLSPDDQNLFLKYVIRAPFGNVGRIQSLDGVANHGFWTSFLAKYTGFIAACNRVPASKGNSPVLEVFARGGGVSAGQLRLATEPRAGAQRREAWMSTVYNPSVRPDSSMETFESEETLSDIPHDYDQSVREYQDQIRIRSEFQMTDAQKTKLEGYGITITKTSGPKRANFAFAPNRRYGTSEFYALNNLRPFLGIKGEITHIQEREGQLVIQREDFRDDLIIPLSKLSVLNNDPYLAQDGDYVPKSISLGKSTTNRISINYASLSILQDLFQDKLQVVNQIPQPLSLTDLVAHLNTLQSASASLKPEHLQLIQHLITQNKITLNAAGNFEVKSEAESLHFRVAPSQAEPVELNTLNPTQTDFEYIKQGEQFGIFARNIQEILNKIPSLARLSDGETATNFVYTNEQVREAINLTPEAQRTATELIILERFGRWGFGDGVNDSDKFLFAIPNSEDPTRAQVLRPDNSLSRNISLPRIGLTYNHGAKTAAIKASPSGYYHDGTINNVSEFIQNGSTLTIKGSTQIVLQPAIEFDDEEGKIRRFENQASIEVNDEHPISYFIDDQGIHIFHQSGDFSGENLQSFSDSVWDNEPSDEQKSFIAHLLQNHPAETAVFSHQVDNIVPLAEAKENNLEGAETLNQADVAYLKDHLGLNFAFNLETQSFDFNSESVPGTQDFLPSSVFFTKTPPQTYKILLIAIKSKHIKGLQTFLHSKSTITESDSTIEFSLDNILQGSVFEFIRDINNKVRANEQLSSSEMNLIFYLKANQSLRYNPETRRFDLESQYYGMQLEVSDEGDDNTAELSPESIKQLRIKNLASYGITYNSTTQKLSLRGARSIPRLSGRGKTLSDYLAGNTELEPDPNNFIQGNKIIRNAAQSPAAPANALITEFDPAIQVETCPDVMTYYNRLGNLASNNISSGPNLNRLNQMGVYQNENRLLFEQPIDINGDEFIGPRFVEIPFQTGIKSIETPEENGTITNLVINFYPGSQLSVLLLPFSKREVLEVLDSNDDPPTDKDYIREETGEFSLNLKNGINLSTFSPLLAASNVHQLVAKINQIYLQVYSIKINGRGIHNTYNALINYLIEKEYATFEDGVLKAEENTPRFNLRIRSTEIPEDHRTTIAGNIDRINDNPSTGVIPELIKIGNHNFRLIQIVQDKNSQKSQAVYQLLGSQTVQRLTLTSDNNYQLTGVNQITDPRVFKSQLISQLSSTTTEFQSAQARESAPELTSQQRAAIQPTPEDLQGQILQRPSSITSYLDSETLSRFTVNQTNRTQLTLSYQGLNFTMLKLDPSKFQWNESLLGIEGFTQLIFNGEGFNHRSLLVLMQLLARNPKANIKYNSDNNQFELKSGARASLPDLTPQSSELIQDGKITWENLERMADTSSVNNLEIQNAPEVFTTANSNLLNVRFPRLKRLTINSKKIQGFNINNSLELIAPNLTEANLQGKNLPIFTYKLQAPNLENLECNQDFLLQLEAFDSEVVAQKFLEQSRSSQSLDEIDNVYKMLDLVRTLDQTKASLQQFSETSAEIRQVILNRINTFIESKDGTNSQHREYLRHFSRTISEASSRLKAYLGDEQFNQIIASINNTIEISPVTKVITPSEIGSLTPEIVSQLQEITVNQSTEDDIISFPDELNLQSVDIIVNNTQATTVSIPSCKSFRAPNLTRLSSLTIKGTYESEEDFTNKVQLPSLTSLVSLHNQPANENSIKLDSLETLGVLYSNRNSNLNFPNLKLISIPKLTAKNLKIPRLESIGPENQGDINCTIMSKIEIPKVFNTRLKNIRMTQIQAPSE